RGASPDRVVRHGAEGLLDIFIDAAKEMVTDGVDGITTNCGFLSLFQEELATAVQVPVATSSLMQVGLVNATLPPGKRSGILTISASALTDRHLAAAGVPKNTPIGTTEGGREFTEAILGNALELDVDASRADNVEAAMALVGSHPEIGALVLECTNMTPYAADIRAAVDCPVFTVESFVSWFHSGLVPRRY
ncbi:MAG: aspartate/glutamate racemase family protein, partial [Boseongicola sp.]